MNRQTASMFSLCKRAGCMVSGEVPAEAAIKENRALLVIIARNASENTRKKFINKAKHYNVNAVVYGSKEEMSSAIGEYNRSVFVIVQNADFAERIHLLITKTDI